MPARQVPSARPTFLTSNRLLARAAQPLVRFLHIEAAGGLLLGLATIIALIWANSPWSGGYEALWSTVIRVEVGSYTFEEDLGHAVNDVLMALFFFVVGMEIKRELVVGELRDRRAVAVPVLAAVGGMAVPALIYAALNAGGDGRSGWGIPMATDIAFALGVVALLGTRVPNSVKVLLLTLAIVDDIGAIAVIAVFYSDALEPRWLVAAVLLGLLVASMHRVRVASPFVLATAGAVLWLAVYESGVHATIAGVVMGLLTPARPLQDALEAEEVTSLLEGRPDVTVEEVRATAALLRDSVSPCDRLIDALHPWTSYVIIPVFALANAGIDLAGDSFTDPSAVLLGVVAGLVVGKLVGIVTFSWLAVRLRLGRLPAGARWVHIVGVGAVAGIGFTVSLFVTGLAFDPGQLQQDAKLGTLGASAIAAAIGTAVFVLAGRPRATPAPLDSADPPA